jgi:two-component system chemotaxis response regulator CheB
MTDTPGTRPTTWESDKPPSGFTCPRCGGTLWENGGSHVLAFRCRIGHQLSLGSMLAEHGARRRESVSAAARHLAEAAALNRTVARWAREQNHAPSAARLESEAALLDARARDLMRLAASALLTLPEEE